jgi:hypothetical protein
MMRHLYRTDDMRAAARQRTNNLRASTRAVGASLSRTESAIGVMPPLRKP